MSQDCVFSIRIIHTFHQSPQKQRKVRVQEKWETGLSGKAQPKNGVKVQKVKMYGGAGLKDSSEKIRRSKAIS